VRGVQSKLERELFPLPASLRFRRVAAGDYTCISVFESLPATGYTIEAVPVDPGLSGIKRLCSYEVRNHSLILLKNEHRYLSDEIAAGFPGGRFDVYQAHLPKSL
jgi:hypothetical protein